MQPMVRICTTDGEVHDLLPGDVVGRHWRAALPVLDGRVSEAHALVSLRGAHLMLLALRGMLGVGGRQRTEVVLEPGVEIELADGLVLEVFEVVLPEQVLALEGDTFGRQVLSGVCSLVADPRLRLARGYVVDALARLWNTGPDWWLELDGAHARILSVGDTFEVRGHTLRGVGVPLARASHRATEREGGYAQPLSLIANYDTVHILREGLPTLVIPGILARILSELLAVAGPVQWRTLAAELWPREDSEIVLRKRLDVNVSRIRRRLRTAGIRSDLVHADGAGSFELLLGPNDHTEDRS